MSGAPASEHASAIALSGQPRMGVVLVNWNRHAFTIEALETLLRSTIPLQVVVVDNASSDGTLERVSAWADGSEPYEVPDGPLARLSNPPLAKPVALARLDAESARATPPVHGQVSLIDGGGNLGFAGGNNLGVQHLLNDPDIDVVWLLNNDTAVEPTAAAQLWHSFQSDPRLGMCGTVVKFYYRPDTVQALNGYRFSLLTGQAKPIGGGRPTSPHMSPQRIADQTDFVLGASLAVSRQFLQTVGPMAEHYFLYYEEIDWATRNAKRFRIGFARGATVYHKEGGSIGSGGGKGARSAMSDYYMQRARLIFYRRHYPLLLPLQYLQGLGLIGRRLVRRQPAKAAAILKAIAGRRFSD